MFRDTRGLKFESEEIIHIGCASINVIVISQTYVVLKSLVYG